MDARLTRLIGIGVGVSLAIVCASCSVGQEPVVAPTPPAPSVVTSPPTPTPTPMPQNAISSDAELFALVTQAEPFAAYGLFPNADEITSGTLNGSSAHHPLVRTSLNATALGALRNGRLPAGAKFPNGSVIFKDVRTNGGSTVTYAVMYKSSDNRLAGNGWLWAEFNPNGTVGYSIMNRGGACTACHSLERGPENDFVRTFERQH
jgi:hypothetical protein